MGTYREEEARLDRQYAGDLDESKPRYETTKPHVVTPEATARANVLFAEAVKAHDRVLMLARISEQLTKAAKDLRDEVKEKRAEAQKILMGQTYLLQ